MQGKRSLGQNFLVDANVAAKIVECLQIHPTETILEIGPGNGVLTALLLQRAHKVLALEKDRVLAGEIKRRWPELGVVNGDALGFYWGRLEGRVSGIVGNLPYNVASPIMWDLARQAPFLCRLVFTVQKEVAQRVAARPCRKEYGGLSVWMQSFLRVHYVFEMSRNVFRPRPKVSSAVLRLEPRPVAKLPAFPDNLSRLIKLCFQNRRKQLGRILRTHWSPGLEEWLQGQGLDQRSRPEELSPFQFVDLSTKLTV